MNLFLRKQLDAMEQALGSSFAEQVAELIKTLLISGACSVEKVADVLGFSRLTLYRRLQAQGTTFEALLDQRRRVLAESMLQRPTIAIAEIADALGYSKQSGTDHDCYADGRLLLADLCRSPAAALGPACVKTSVIV